MREITALYVVGTDAPEDIRFASPYDLFRRSDGMSTLLTACGEPPELLPDGGAPDYDKLAALCRALPLAPGHPLRRRILALLAEGFEWHDPRPDPAALWRHLTRFISPDAQESDLTLAALARRMGAAPDVPDRLFMLTLPDGYAFVRPDPYHAALCRRQEETLPKREDILYL